MPSALYPVDWSDTWYNIDPRHRMVDEEKWHIYQKPQPQGHMHVCFYSSRAMQSSTQDSLSKMKLPMKLSVKLYCSEVDRRIRTSIALRRMSPKSSS